MTAGSNAGGRQTSDSSPQSSSVFTSCTLSDPSRTALVPIGLYVVSSLITYAVYAFDKRRAKQKSWRIPERTLLTWAFVSGGLAALAARKALRHKTRKPLFFWLPLAFTGVHIGAWIYWAVG